ncbi:hypothetical protein PMAYCL1PPCAC_00043, partial [Pristionchus mayeri]
PAFAASCLCHCILHEDNAVATDLQQHGDSTRQEENVHCILRKYGVLRPERRMIVLVEEMAKEKARRQARELPGTMLDWVKDSVEQIGKEGYIMMKNLVEHIGTAKTRCTLCGFIFENSDEYYDHLLSFYHLNFMMGKLDVYTLLVNVQLKERSKALLELYI